MDPAAFVLRDFSVAERKLKYGESVRRGKDANTIFFYIVGDNGTSPEGTLYGAFNQLTAYNGILKAPEALQMLFGDSAQHGAIERHLTAWREAHLRETGEEDRQPDRRRREQPCRPSIRRPLPASAAGH
jgi:hypothetical protein